MKKATFLLVLFLISQNAISQSLIAVQNGGTPSFYTDLGNAINNAVDGDTIYIPGRSYTLNKTINKRLHLVGTGINPNSTSATGITSISSPSIVSPQIVLGENADGGSISGINFTSNYYNGNPYFNIGTNSNAVINNFLIDRCFFGSSVSGQFENSLIKGSIFRHRSYFVPQNGNTLVSNNLFLSRSNSFSYCTVSNNVFFTGLQYYQAINASNSLIENNILPQNYPFDNLNNCNVRNNVNTNNNSGTNIKTNNFDDNIDLSVVFVDYNGSTSEAINFTADFNLPDSSPYKNAGADGTDIGIYGGRFPWKDGEAPFNPQIVFKDIEGNTDENGNIQVEIHVEAQGN